MILSDLEGHFSCLKSFQLPSLENVTSINDDMFTC